MRVSATAAAIALLLLAGASAPGHAADLDGALNALAGAAVTNAELGHDRARGIVLNGATSTGSIGQNTIGNGALTGVITTTNSINNNSGLTTVFQNTGNNSLFQSSTSIYINIR